MNRRTFLGVLGTGLLCSGVGGAEKSPTPTSTDDHAFASFDKEMEEFMAGRKIPGGALAVVKKGRLVYARGYGWANREMQLPVTPDSLFRIASISKPFTALAVPGQWQRTPPFFRPPLTPHWGFVDTFCLPDIEPFVPGPPPALDSPEYAVAVNEVKMLGRKTNTTRTADQSQIAVFWSEASSDFNHWTVVCTNTAASGGVIVNDAAGTTNRMRIYRVVEPN